MFFRDLRYALRSLGRSPGLTAALLATVAVGIGTHAAVGGFINGLLGHGLAIPEARRIAAVYARDEQARYVSVPYAGFLALRSSADTFESLAAFRESRASVTLHGRASWMTVARATREIWDVVRIPAALGRISFAAVEGSPATPVVIAARVWRNEYAAGAEAIGADVVVDGRAATIVGVVPDWFEGVYVGRPVDVWIPFGEQGAAAARGAFSVVGRLRDGATVADAQQQTAALAGASTVVLTYSGTEPEVQIKLAQLKRLLGWAAALVFLTAAASVIGLLLSRAVRRSQETAARIILGASFGRIAGLVLADSVVISICGGALGGLVAYWTAGALPALLYVEDAERLRFTADGWQVGAIAAGYSATMLVCALAPLLQIRKQGPMEVLRRSGGGPASATSRLRSSLVVGQMFVCVVLVIGTALLFQGFRQALRTVRADRLGEPVVAMLEGVGYARQALGEEYLRRTQREVLAVPGVTAAALVATLPGGRPSTASVRVEPLPIGSKEISVDAITPPGRRLLAYTLKEGRMFRGGDGPFSCGVALVNEPMAALYFNGDAIGRAMRDSSGRRIDIVGVVRAPETSAAERLQPTVYFYEGQALTPPSRDVKTARLRIGVMLPSPRESAEIDVNVASATYFDIVGAVFESGQSLAGGGAATNGCDVGVVNREASQLYFDGHAVGAALIDGEGQRTEIAGVVDAGPLRVTQRRPAPMVYYPVERHYIPRMALIAAARQATPALMAEIARRLAGLPGAAHDPAVLTLDEQNARTSLGPERIATLLVGTCAAIALGLAVLGVYGVMSDAVLQKRRDIALRLALGAQASAIVGGVLRDGLRIAGSGAAGGMAAAWILVEFLRHSDPGFHAPALWTWLACPLVLLAIVMLASILPARWALAVDPMTITRDE